MYSDVYFMISESLIAACSAGLAFTEAPSWYVAGHVFIEAANDLLTRQRMTAISTLQIIATHLSSFIIVHHCGHGDMVTQQHTICNTLVTRL